jgi:uncharacterized protein YjbI with pentapeptide repeats
MQLMAPQAFPPRAESPAYTQPVLDRLLDLHERFVRGAPNGRRAMVRYLQATDLDFRGRKLVEADFTGANLRHACLKEVDLERASLYCADLTGADARSARFVRADLRGVALRHANLSGAIFDECDLREATLARVDLPGGFHTQGSVGPDTSDNAHPSADFTNSSLKGARLSNSNLRNADFSGALMQGAKLKGAALGGAVFTGAVLTGVSLVGLQLDPGALKDCVLDPTPEAHHRAEELMRRIEAAGRWVVTSGIEGAPAQLDDEDLRPLSHAFPGRRLTALSAQRACGVGVDFSGAHLQGARFDGADLRDADFTGADLRGASFKGARLWHARFAEADLRALPLNSGLARAVNLEGATFAGDCFAKSQMDGAVIARKG